MSNIANPGCCCEVGPYYPWLCYETKTQSNGAVAGLASSGQIVRVPIVTVSYAGFGSGGVPWYDANASYPAGAKVYISTTNKVWTANEDVSLSGMSAGPFNEDLWTEGVVVPDQDVSKKCAPVDGAPVTSTADKHWVPFDVINTITGSPIDEVANIALRTPGVSYAWHIVQDMRVFSNDFKPHVSYNSGDRIKTSPIDCEGQYTCDDSIFPDTDTDCCSEWVVKEPFVAGSSFSESDWNAVDPNGSKYYLILADWSQPEAWISGEPATIIASRQLSNIGLSEANDPMLNLDRNGIEEMATPAESFMVSRPNANNQENLSFLPQSKRVFMSSTMSNLYPENRDMNTGRGWGNVYSNVQSDYSFGWQGYSMSFGEKDGKCTEKPCNDYVKRLPKGGDAPGGGAYGSVTEANVSTISADDTNFYYFEIVPLAPGESTPMLCGECDDCMIPEGDPPESTCHGPGRQVSCGEISPDWPAEEGPMRRKIVVQHWQRAGSVITYKGNLSYPDCSGNWKGKECQYGFSPWQNNNYTYGLEEKRLVSSCKPSDCNKPGGSSAFNTNDGYWTNFNGCNFPRNADIIYVFEDTSSKGAKAKKRKTWYGDGDGTMGNCACIKPQKMGVVQYETIPQVFAMAPRAPLRSLSVRSRHWGGLDQFLQGDYPNHTKPPTNCIMDNHQCGGEVRCRKKRDENGDIVIDWGGNFQWYSACKIGRPLRNGCKPYEGTLYPQPKFQIHCSFTTDVLGEPIGIACEYKHKLTERELEPCTADGADYVPGDPSSWHQKHIRAQKHNVGMVELQWWWGGWAEDSYGNEQFYYNDAMPTTHSSGGFTTDVAGEPLGYPICMLPAVGGDLPKWDNAANDKTYADLCALQERVHSLLERGEYYNGYGGPGRMSCGIATDYAADCGGAFGRYGVPDTQVGRILFMAENCCYCRDAGLGGAERTSDGYIGRISPGGIPLPGPMIGAFADYDFGHPGAYAKCSMNRFERNCQQLDNLTTTYDVYADLLVGYPSTGAFTTGQFSKYHYNNKNLFYALKSPKKIWSQKFEFTARSYAITELSWSNRIRIGTTPYAYDAAKEGEIVDMVAHTLIEPSKINIDYYKKRTSSPIVWQNFYAGQEIIEQSAFERAQGRRDFQDSRLPVVVCVGGKEVIQCTKAVPLKKFSDVVHNCGSVLSWDCKGYGANVYGNTEILFQKYKLWNKLFITSAQSKAVYDEEEYDCSRQYHEGDIVEYGGCVYVANQTTLSTSGVWVGHPDYVDSERYNCTKQYAKGDLVRMESGNSNQTYIWSAKEITPDPQTKCPECGGGENICPWDCNATYSEGDQMILTGVGSLLPYIWTANTDVQTGNCTKYPKYDPSKRYSRGDKVTYDPNNTDAESPNRSWIACLDAEAYPKGDCCTECGDTTEYVGFDCQSEFNIGDKIAYNCKLYEAKKDWGPFEPYNCSGHVYSSGEVVSYNGYIWIFNDVKNTGCNPEKAIAAWSPTGPAIGGVGDNNAYPSGMKVAVSGLECSQCMDSIGNCWRAQSVYDEPTPRTFVENYFYPTDGMTTYWKRCPSSGCCDFDRDQWTVSGSCIDVIEGAWEEVTVDCPFDQAKWTETGVCCLFDYSKWTRDKRAYCCPFDSGLWERKEAVTECNEECCPFEAPGWDCHIDYEMGDVVTYEDSSWTANIGIFAADCVNGCCPFDASQWASGDSLSPYWDRTDLECVSNDDMPIVEHWYNAYYHRDILPSESSVSFYDSGNFYTKGDVVRYPNPHEGGWGTDQVYTNISYKNPEATARGNLPAREGAGDDPLGTDAGGFNQDHWILGRVDASKGINKSPAKAFEHLTYPKEYPYAKYERRIIGGPWAFGGGSPATMYEAYPFYRGCSCSPGTPGGYECFNPNTTYGSTEICPQVAPIVLADAEGYNMSYPKEDGSFGELSLWMLNVDPGLKWDSNHVRDAEMAGTTCGGAGPQIENWTVKGWWVYDNSNGQQSTWHSTGRTQFTEKWRSIGTRESQVGCPIDNLIFFTHPDEVVQPVWSPLDYQNAGQKCRYDGGGPGYNIDDECWVPEGNSLGYVQATLNAYNEPETPTAGFRNPGGGLYGKCSIRCGPNWNHNYGYCHAGVTSENPDGIADGQGFTDSLVQTFSFCHWRPVHQPEYYDANDKLDFFGLHQSRTSLTPSKETAIAAIPPPSYKGTLFAQRHNLDITINTLSATASNSSLANPRSEVTSLCPAVHVVKKSENGQGLQAAVWWDSSYRWDHYDRLVHSQRTEYTYREWLKGGPGSVEQAPSDFACTCGEDTSLDDCYDYVDSKVNGPNFLTSWRLRWFDGNTEVLHAASPPSFYVSNDAQNHSMGTCDPLEGTYENPDYNNRLSPCWDHVVNSYSDAKTNTKNYSWLPWIDWSSDRWLFLYNFPLTTKDFENFDIELSSYAELNDLGQADGVPWNNQTPLGMELLYPSYIPPATEDYDPNSIGGYAHIPSTLPSDFVDRRHTSYDHAHQNNCGEVLGEVGKVLGGDWGDNQWLLPAPIRISHSPHETDNPIENQKNADLIAATKQEYTAIAPSTGFPPTWSSVGPSADTSKYPYRVGSIIEYVSDGNLYTYKSIRIDPNGATEGELPDTSESLFWTRLSEYSATNRAVVAGSWAAQSGNFFPQAGDGYLWTDWMVSHGGGHANAGKLWIPIGCRTRDAYTDKEHMRSTTYFGNNVKGGSVDGLTHGNRRYDAVGRTVGVPLTPPSIDHSQDPSV